MRDVCRFSIIQYVPDPIANERLNIGVVVAANQRIHVRFLHNWQRIKKIAGTDDLVYLRDFADFFESLALEVNPVSQLQLFEQPIEGSTAEDVFLWYAANWNRSIQFTTPQPAIEDPQHLLERMALRCLMGPSAELKRATKTRNQLIGQTAKSIRGAMSQASDQLELTRYLYTKISVPGELVKETKFDLALMDGYVYSATQTLSFQSGDLRDLHLLSRDAVWSLSDLRNRWPRAVTSLVIAPPIASNLNRGKAAAMMDDARFSADKARIEIVEERDTDEWALSLVQILRSMTGESLETLSEENSTFTV